MSIQRPGDSLATLCQPTPAGSSFMSLCVCVFHTWPVTEQSAVNESFILLFIEKWNHMRTPASSDATAAHCVSKWVVIKSFIHLPTSLWSAVIYYRIISRTKKYGAIDGIEQLSIPFQWEFIGTHLSTFSAITGDLSPKLIWIIR